MKKLIGLIIVFLSIGIVFTSCEKEKKNVMDEISLTSYEPEVTVKGSGKTKDYTKVVAVNLVKDANCKYEVVSGIVKYFYQKDFVYSKDFGNGQCDGLATITWVDKNNVTQTKVVNVWGLFKK